VNLPERLQEAKLRSKKLLGNELATLVPSRLAEAWVSQEPALQRTAADVPDKALHKLAEALSSSAGLGCLSQLFLIRSNSLERKLPFLQRKAAALEISAPASQLPELLSISSDLLNWVIGSQVLVSWPANFPEVTTESITTAIGNKTYRGIANQCITNELFEAIARNEIKQELFKTNPLNDPAWKKIAKEQTAPIPDSSQPVLVAESLSDKIIAPDVTALYIQNACKAKANVQTIWVNNVAHMKLPNTIAPQAIDWIADRFAGKPNSSSCDQQLPIAPARQIP
jgi:hypothetical protein